MMTALQYTFLIISALFGLLGVAAGAFGTHLLKSRRSSDSFAVFDVAVRYQMYHVLALLSIVAILGWLPSALIVAAGWLFVVGIIIFSGSLYALVFSGIRSWGVITPIGGLLLLIGWLILLLGGIVG
jgi:uncharacterized membrane protein YgdD (TMEM256/DUF423 family)